MKKQKIVIFTAIGLILFFMLAGSLYKKQQSDEITNMAKENASVLQRDYSMTFGNQDAKVHLVEFFDPACATCAAFHPFVKNIMKKNEGKIRLTHRYAPFHEGSDYVIKMLEAARNQGKYLETLEMMFATQEYWTSNHKANPQVLWQFLPKLGLDIDRMVIDMKDSKLDKIIAQDLADAKKLGANKTPSYFVNGKPLQQFGYQQLEDLIYSEL